MLLGLELEGCKGYGFNCFGLSLLAVQGFQLPL